MSYQEVVKTFGNRLRVRVCGICIQDNSVLLVRHKYVGKLGYFWSPPGGGMEFGSTAQDNLVREFKEETGLDIEVKNFLFTNEFLSPPLHAIELFFDVKVVGGSLKTGHDPEMDEQSQIIKEVKFMSFGELLSLPESAVHNMLTFCKDPMEILNLKGYFMFE